MTIRRAILLHGTGAQPDFFWFPWLKRELEQAGLSVQAPQLPNADEPRLDTWTPFILGQCGLDENTVVVGHSAGAAVILSLLQSLEKPVARAVLVAGFSYPIPHMPADHPMLLPNPDWARMKGNCADIAFIHSDDDPWGCTHKQGEVLREKLGGTLVVKTGHGHFGSRVFNQEYSEFPLLRDICLAGAGR